jgi:hypothetical protein
MKFLTLVIALGVAVTRLEAKTSDPIFPRNIGELGYVAAQPAYFFSPQDVRVLRFRPDLFRVSTGMAIESDELLKIIAVTSGAYITHQQFDWNGILMRIEANLTGPRFVYSGFSDGRGSAHDFFHPFESESNHWGARSAKGTGISASSEIRTKTLISMLSALKKEEPAVDVTSESALRGLRAEVSHFKQRRIAIDVEMSRTNDLIKRQQLRFAVQELENQIELYEIFLSGWEEVKDLETLTPFAAKISLDFAEKLSKMDYVNGMIEGPRALKEMLNFEIMNEIYEILNSEWGTSFGVLPIDIVFELPIKMYGITYQKEVRAGVLERPPHIKAVNYQCEDGTWRFWWPEAIIKSDIPGNEQFDANGLLLDLETLYVADGFGLDEFYRKEKNGRAIDRLCLEVTEAAESGNSHAIPELFEKMKKKLDREAIHRWAKENRPPSQYFETEDPFLRARALLASPVVDPLKLKELENLLNTIHDLRHFDQITLLWPRVLKQALPVVTPFLSRIFSKAALFDQEKRESAAGEGSPVHVALDDLSLLDIMMTLQTGSNGQGMAPIRRHVAEMLAAASLNVARGIYSMIGPELYRRRHFLNDWYDSTLSSGHFNRFLAEHMFSFASRAMYFFHTPHLTPGLTLEELTKPIERDGHSFTLAQMTSMLTDNDPVIIESFIDSVEQMMGMPVPAEMVALFFPHYSLAVARISGTIGTEADQLSHCIRELVTKKNSISSSRKFD